MTRICLKSASLTSWQGRRSAWNLWRKWLHLIIDIYYLRRRICEYQKRTSIDLLQQCFEQITGNQIRLDAQQERLYGQVNLTAAISPACLATNWFIQPSSNSLRHVRLSVSPQIRKNKQTNIWQKILKDHLPFWIRHASKQYCKDRKFQHGDTCCFSCYHCIA